MSKLLVKIPTKWRGLNWLNDWLIKSTVCDFLISVDSDEYAYPQLPNIDRVFFEIGESQNKIHAINRDLDKYIDNYDIIAVFGDDFRPSKDFDLQIIDLFETLGDGQNDFYLHCNDGYTDSRLCTYPIMGRDWYKRFGYVYNPIYKSVFCDNEQTEVAKLIGKYTYSPQIICRHEHYVNNRLISKDELYEKNEKLEAGDRGVFLQRKKINFGL